MILGWLYSMYSYTTLFKVYPTARIDVLVERHGLSVDMPQLILAVDSILGRSLDVQI